MISGTFTILKSLIITIIVCAFLQIRLGEKTVEQNLYKWIQTSVVVEYMQTSIDGAVKITQLSYKQVNKVINKALSKMSRHEKKVERGINITLKRFNDKDKNKDEDENSTEVFVPKAKSKSVQIE